MKRSSLLANTLGQISTAAFGLVFTPWYISLLGVEAYGLVAFSMMVQAWMSLLDGGFSQVLARDTARAQAGQLDREAYAAFVRSFEWLLIGISLPLLLGVWAGAEWVARHWLKTGGLAVGDVIDSLHLLFLMCILRWFTAIYRGILMGQDRQVLSNLHLFGFALLRFLGGGLLLFMAEQPSPQLLFGFWLLVALLEFVTLRFLCFYRQPLARSLACFDLGSLLSRRSIVGPIIFSSVIWLLLTQLDKLVLSRALSLADYGIYGVVAMLSNGLLFLAQPLVQASQPRLTALAGAEDSSRLAPYVLALGRAFVLLLLPVTVVMAADPVNTLAFWVGKAVVAPELNLALSLYVLGSFVVGLCLLVYLLQVAVGNLRFHFWGNLVVAILLLPLIPFLVSRYGVLGAAAAWCGINALFFLLWVPVVLRKIGFSFALVWYREALLITVLVFAAILALRGWLPAAQGRWQLLLVLGLEWLLASLLAWGLLYLLAGRRWHHALFKEQ